jgi:hypothetical protein
VWHWLSAPGFWLLLGFTGVYFLTSAFDFFISDGEVMYQTAREIALRGRIDQPNTPGLSQIIQGSDGLFYSKYGLGQPLLAAGLFRFGKWLWFNFMPEKWDEPIAHFAVTLLPMLATALTAWLVYLFGKRLFQSRKIGIGLALLFGLGTSAWPYSHFFFSEPLFSLCSFAAAYALFRAKESKTLWLQNFWLLTGGLAFGYALLTRVSGLALLPAYLLYLWLIANPAFARKEWLKTLLDPRFLRYAILFGVGVVPALLLTAYFNVVRFGNPLTSGYEGEGFTTPIWEGLWGLLFSTGKSVFLYSPVLVALPFALRALLRYARPETLFFSAILSITLLYYGAWWAFYGGYSWGPRFLVPLLPFGVLALGVLLQKSRTWVVLIFCGLFPLAVFVQMLGVAVNFNTHLINVTQGIPGWDANYIFIPHYSPLRGNFELFWNPANNVIRALTLEQLGLNHRMAKVFTFGAWGSFILSLFMICYGYFKSVSRNNIKPGNEVNAVEAPPRTRALS